jgi:hypothetical protein
MGVFGFVAEILVFGGLVLGGRFSKKELRAQRGLNRSYASKQQ